MKVYNHYPCEKYLMGFVKSGQGQLFRWVHEQL